MLNLKKYLLLSFLSCLCALSNLFAQIPNHILNSWEQSEYQSSIGNKDSAIYFLRKTQREFFTIKDSVHAINLYANIIARAVDSKIKYDYQNAEKSVELDSFLFWVKEYDALLNKNVLTKDMLKKYYVSKYIFFETPTYKNKLLELIDTLNCETDWEYCFLMYSCDSHLEYSEKKIMYKSFLYSSKAYSILEKYAPKYPQRAVYLTFLYTYDLTFFLSEYASMLLRTTKDFEKALSIEYKLLNYLENYKYPDIEWISICYNKISEIYFYKKDYQKALTFIKKASDIVAHIPDNEGLYDYNLATIYFEMEDYNQTIKYSKSTLRAETNDQRRKSGDYDEYSIMKAYYYMCIAQLKNGNIEQAKVHLDSLLSTDLIKQYPNYKHICQGYYYEKINDFNKADSCYKIGVKKSFEKSTNTSDFFYYLASFLIKSKKYDVGAKYARNFFNTTLKSDKIKNVEDYDKITVEDVLHTHKALQAILLILDVSQGLGLKTNKELFYYKAKADFGIAVLNDLLKSLEREGSQNSILKLSYPIYEHAINAAYHLHRLTGKKAYLDTAFQYMEDSKSILLSQTLAEKQAQGFAGVDAKLIEMERTLTKDIQFYTQQARDAKTRKDEAAERLYQGYVFDFGLRLDSLKKRLNQEYPSYYALKYQIPPIGIEAVQKHLNDTSLFIEYFEGQEAYFAIAISRNASKLVKIPISKTEKELIHTFNNAVQSHQIKKTPSELQEMGNRIYKLLLDSLLSDTKIFINADKIQRLVLIPDGKLSYLPFEALVANPLKGDANPTLAKLPYLLYQYAHNYQYSARLWLQMSGKKPQTIAQILGFAAYYPDQDSLQLSKLTLQAQRIRKNLTPLKGALQEVAHLRSKYAGNYYSEAAATEKQLRQSLQSAEKYQILHLAMHGLVNEETPEWSCLGFSPSADSLEDDLLQAHEIKALQMNQGEGLDMVVLSACETGLGKYQHGEGVISLGRGFVYGGANSLVMSLWSVNDDASAFLMEKFYAYLAAGLEKDEALRQAKLDYLQAAQGQDLACHPALWAAFVQLGNIEPLNLQISQKSLPLRIFAFAGLGLLFLGVGYWGWKKYKLQAES